MTNAHPEFNVLLHAISSCAGIAVKQIVEQDPSILKIRGWHGQTALHKACLTGDCPTVDLLLQHGADPNAVNDYNETPVHYASKRGNPLLVHALEKYGAKLDVKDSSGRLPVHLAAQTGSVYMLQFFEEKAMGFHHVDNNLQSPLHHACFFGHLEAFKYLMKKGRSEPTLKDKDGNTPLHICAQEGYAHGSWILLNVLGISALKVTNSKGYTPLDICRQHGKPGHKQLLPVLESIERNPARSLTLYPRLLWYYWLLMPATVYGLAVVLSCLIFTDYQGFVLFGSVAFIIKSAKGAGHRIDHICRWPNPLFAGLFAAGMLHTMIVYYLDIMLCNNNAVFSIISVIFTAIQLCLYWKLLRQDAGVASGSGLAGSGQPTSMAQLIDRGLKLDMFCGDCEIIKPKETKHCKLCERCFHKMDHHCLFLLNCVARNNHARFVWFLLHTAFVMSMFVLQTYLCLYERYPRQAFMEILGQMFWSDCWPLSMALLNICSVFWALILVRVQLKVVSKGQTTYFQTPVTLLTNMEKLLNVINFLQGKEAYATDDEWQMAPIDSKPPMFQV